MFSAAKSRTSAPVRASQILAELMNSLFTLEPHDATSLPSRLTLTAFIRRSIVKNSAFDSAPLQERSSRPDATSHTWMPPGASPQNRLLPSREKATEVTAPL